MISLILVFTTALWGPESIVNRNTTSIGLPMRFIWYYDFEGLPTNRFEMIREYNLSKIHFQLLNFLINTMLVYFIISYVSKLLNRIQKSYNKNNRVEGN